MPTELLEKVTLKELRTALENALSSAAKYEREPSRENKKALLIALVRTIETASNTVSSLR